MKKSSLKIQALRALLLAGLVSSASAATVATFTGGDVGEGIDFSGTVIHALMPGAGSNDPPAATDLLISGLTFKDCFAGAPLVLGVAPAYAAINNYGTLPEYGGSANDNNLEALIHDIAHSFGGVTFTGLALNQQYQLQVLVAENNGALSAGRRTSYALYSGIDTSGVLQDASLNMDLWTIQGQNHNTGVVVTLTGTSDNLGRLFFTAPAGVGGTDGNGIASGMILTLVPEPSSAMLAGVALLPLLARRRRQA